MTTIQRLRTSGRHGSRARGYVPFRPRLEILEDRRLLAACTVSNTNDDLNSGSLRYCLTTPTDPDPITITATGTIQLGSALPAIDWNVTIDGPVTGGGAPNITVQGEGEADPYRIFEISSGTVTMRDLIISDGVAADGGGIKNSGDLTLSNVIVEHNVAEQLNGEDEIFGGGISNYGDLLITDVSRIRENNIAGGQDCKLQGEGGGLPLCPFLFGGGGIHNAADAHVVIEDGSFVTDNVICDPDHNTLDPCEANQYPSDAASYLGGGIHNKGNDGGTVNVIQSTVDGNAVFAIDPGDELGFRGQGGGIQSECDNVAVEWCIVIDSSTFSGNSVVALGTVENQSFVVESVAQGAAMAVAGAEVLQEGFGDDPIQAAYKVKIVNSTFTGNAVESDVTGTICGTYPDPLTGSCRAGGGAIWFKGIHMDIRSSSFVGNTALSVTENARAAAISASDVPVSYLFLGGSLFVNNIVDDDVESNFDLTDGFEIDSLGRNLFDDDPDVGEIMTDQVNTEVCFLPLQDQGGPTHTLELAKCGSTAIPALNLGGDPAFDFDQRGEDRIFGSHADVGAFECQSGECEEERGGSGISLPHAGFDVYSSDVSDESGLLFDQHCIASKLSDASSNPMKTAIVFGSAVTSRVLPIRTDTVSLWNDPLFVMGADAGLDLFSAGR